MTNHWHDTLDLEAADSKFHVNSSHGFGAEWSINGPTQCSCECGWQWSRLCVSRGLTNAFLHKHSSGADFYFQSYFRPNRQPTTYEPRALSSALASFQLSSIHLPPGCESWAPLTRLRQYTSLFEPWRKPFSHADEKPRSKKKKKNQTRMFFFIFSAKPVTSASERRDSILAVCLIEAYCLINSRWIAFNSAVIYFIYYSISAKLTKLQR